MRPAQRARRRLKGSWLTANAVQCTRISSSLIVLLGEMALLRLLGLGAEKVVDAETLWSGGWMYGAVLLGMLLLDWLLVSPILAGQALYYRRLAETPVSPRTAEDGEKEELDEIAKTRELSVNVPAPERPSYSLIFFFFHHGYWRTLSWRLGLFVRRLGWGMLCYAPSALIAGYGEIIRRSGSRTPLADMTMLLCTLLGLMALLGGFVVLEMLMLRYLPAQYLLADPKEGGLFRQARHIMHARVGETIWLYLGFAGWFAASLAVIPYFYAAPLFQTTRAAAVLRFIRYAPPEQQRGQKKGENRTPPIRRRRDRVQAQPAKIQKESRSGI